ncbi:MAG: thermonuclease family protein [Bryobacterales bacterium]|nr:thermonuclease family protein [Bryobacterales bacterium]MDE0295855.1 thermonuclease family protein [Bryobacterales bacterium]
MMELLAMIAILVAFYVIAKRARRKKPGDTITGRAYVTDGDGLKVKGYKVRLAGLDAPEWNQPAKHRWGFWFNHGKRVKGALIREIGGRRVQVAVEGFDRYGRVLGTVSCRGCDVGEWLVRSGHAIACYDNRYQDAESAAKSERRGMWSYKEAYDPRAWRRR